MSLSTAQMCMSHRPATECGRCGAGVSLAYRVCPGCVKLAREAKKKRYMSLVNLGYCGRCGKKRDPDHHVCEACRTIQAESYRRRKAKT